MKRFCFALELIDDEVMIEEYKAHHRNFWPELRQNAFNSGIRSIELYLAGNRLFMVQDTEDDFDPKNENQHQDTWLTQRSNEWEALMSKYQKKIPSAKPGQKWVLMEQIFEL
jgi:L-rhamnose mutarotase